MLRGHRVHREFQIRGKPNVKEKNLGPGFGFASPGGKERSGQAVRAMRVKAFFVMAVTSALILSALALSPVRAESPAKGGVNIYVNGNALTHDCRSFLVKPS